MMMIIILLILIICIVCTEGLVPRTISGANSDPTGSGGNRINKQIELSKDKVVTTIELKNNEKIVLCRCWRSVLLTLSLPSLSSLSSLPGQVSSL